MIKHHPQSITIFDSDVNLLLSSLFHAVSRYFEGVHRVVAALYLLSRKVIVAQSWIRKQINQDLSDIGVVDLVLVDSFTRLSTAH